MNRQLTSCAILTAALTQAASFAAAAATPEPSTVPTAKPNIIYILADDLGIGDLGCYGQTKIRTPNIDRIAAEGMRFTNHYSGSTVCAPSRCTLITGFHTGHAFIRGNREIKGTDGQWPLPSDTVTVAKLLKSAGYATAVVGKWGLGNPESTGAPLKQGFDHSFGPNCQRVSHSFYPAYTWCDDKTMAINQGCAVPGHARLPKHADPNDPASYRHFIGKDYVPDLMEKDAIQWIKTNRDKPFFLYYATPIPHVALQVPEDSLAEYKDKFNDKPYLGNNGYLPCRYPRATYAAMITRMDRSIGRIMDTLKELGLDENTIILFCSDNGPTFNGGSDSAYFKSALNLRGLKCSVYEGGIRAPFVARWPGKIQPGASSDCFSAMWDFLPTVCELAHVQTPGKTDGISLLPALLGKAPAKTHEYLCWEDAGDKRALVTADGWKGILYHPSLKFELYNLNADPAETRNLATTQPEPAAKVRQLLDTVRVDSPDFPLVTAPRKKPGNQNGK